MSVLYAVKVKKKKKKKKMNKTELYKRIFICMCAIQQRNTFIRDWKKIRLKKKMIKAGERILKERKKNKLIK